MARHVTEGPVPLDDAFRFCERLARKRYENFPVASFFLPRTKRRFISALYAYARTADDFADEGSRSQAERIRLLDEWERRLDACFAGCPEGPIFTALAETVRSTGIPREPLANLLKAFRSDVISQTYVTAEDVLAYCRNSANPIGQLVLYVFGQANAKTLSLSDALCTALQLTNFLQDLSRDVPRGRIYLPLDDMARFGYTAEDLRGRVVNERLLAVLQHNVGQIRRLFSTATDLPGLVDRSLRLELALTLRGGLAVLGKIEALGTAVLLRRPALSAIDKAGVFLTSVLYRQT